MACTGRDHKSTALAIQRCTEKASFKNIVIFTNDASEFKRMDFDLLERVEYIDAGPWEDWEELSVFGLTEIPKYANLYGTHVLGVHWDGFIVNQAAWNDSWLQYDYIGAAWPDGVVGNNGFCLVSQRYFSAVQQLGLRPTVEDCHPGDAMVCRTAWRHKKCHRIDMEQAGVRFAPLGVAKAFSVENEEYTSSFGFHGEFTLISAFKKGKL